MTAAQERRVSLLDRLADLSESQRSALARALAEEDQAPGRQQLVAYLAATGEPPATAELDAFLKDRLPEYMIPSRYILLEHLPRSPSGKLDRQGVGAEVGTDLGSRSTGVVPPRNEAEARLAEIWKNVLGIDEISVYDDFFEIGGDSLLSIRVISRAGRAGIGISPETFFTDPTIARLAALAGSDAPQAEQDVVVGEAPLTPIQEWFLERITEEQGHWNQSVLLDAPRSADREALERAVAALIAHHDALRLRFVRRVDGWRQEFRDVPDRLPVRAVDLSDTPTRERPARIEDEADAEHASLDLEDESLFRVVLFEGGPGCRRVLLLAHHLLVDGLSWGILLDDLSTLLGQSVGGSPLHLPRKTASAFAWAEGLVKAARRPEVASTAAYWVDTHVPASWANVPSDMEAGPQGNRMGN